MQQSLIWDWEVYFLSRNPPTNFFYFIKIKRTAQQIIWIVCELTWTEDLHCRIAEQGQDSRLPSLKRPFVYVLVHDTLQCLGCEEFVVSTHHELSARVRGAFVGGFWFKKKRRKQKGYEQIAFLRIAWSVNPAPYYFSASSIEEAVQTYYFWSCPVPVALAASAAEKPSDKTRCIVYSDHIQQSLMANETAFIASHEDAMVFACRRHLFCQS